MSPGTELKKEGRMGKREMREMGRGSGKRSEEKRGGRRKTREGEGEEGREKGERSREKGKEGEGRKKVGRERKRLLYCLAFPRWASSPARFPSLAMSNRASSMVHIPGL